MRRPPLWVVDTALAAVFAVSAQVELRVRFEDGPFLGPLWWNSLIDLLFCLPLVLRRTRVRTTFVVLGAVYLLPRLVAPHASLFFGNFLPFLLVVYTVARYAEPRWARLAWTGGVVCWLGFLAHSGSHLHDVIDPVLPVGLAVLVSVVGRMLGRRDRQRTDLAEALRRLSLAQAAREHEVAALERARVAGDMHDVVGHAVSLMVVQIGHARMSLEADGRPRARLREAESAGRGALADLRRGLAVLRDQPEPPGPARHAARSSRRPAPSPRQRWTDALVAVALTAVAVWESATRLVDDGYHSGPRALDVAVAVAFCLPLALRRTAPRATYAVMLAVFCLPTLVVGHSLYLYGTLVPLCLAVYSVASVDDGWLARSSWASGALLVVLGGARTPGAAAPGDIVFSLVFTVSAWAVGRARRRLDADAERLRATLAALADEADAREEAAAQRERQRIAAEMHDVVAHAVSAMTAQLGAARLEEPDGEAAERLRVAAATGHQALDELRRTLGLLQGDDEAALRPLPDLADLPGLVGSVRAAGLAVEVDGAVGPLPDAVGLAAYRIVQEALTNALKHGGPGRARLSLRERDGALVVRVDTPAGAGVALPSGGRGLAGMRQRVALYDGTLSAGPAGDRYVVEAVLRIAPEPAPVLV